MRIQLGDQQDRVSVRVAVVRRLVRAAFRGRPGQYDEVNVVLVGDAEIRRLNSQFRSKDRATDVLSFDLRTDTLPGVEVPRAGEVIVSTDSTLRQAKTHGVSVAEELARLCIHGCLHLQGFDHQRPVERQEMRRFESDILEVVSPFLDELVIDAARA